MKRTDRGLSPRCTVHGRYLEQTVGIDLEGGDKLSLSTGHRWDTVQLEFSEQTVVAALCALTLVYGEGDCCLVVLDGGEGTGLVGGDGGVTGNDDTEDVALHCYTEGERCNIEEEKVLGLLGCLTGENSGLDGGTVRNGLIGVDGLVQRASTEELADQCLNLWDTSGATNKDNVVDLGCAIVSE